MLFNSYVFLFVFLPSALIVYFTVGQRLGYRHALWAMSGLSLFFYAWWDPWNLRVLIPSLLVNFAFGRLLTSGRLPLVIRKGALAVAVIFNLGLLGYYKYGHFFSDTVAALTGADFRLEKLALPLAISFFTFEQIAYVVDAFRKEARRYSFAEYCFFVTFFPRLIAGPIIQHDELINQLQPERARFDARNFAVGVTLFILGLAKKVLVADALSAHVAAVYDTGNVPTFFAAWVGTAAYSLQLYFDFSGYSDMAIGLARMVNITLPANFNSPYKAPNIIEFWRRWHMTLSRFLRKYLYIPLGGNRHGKVRRYVNLLLTMLLGGLWHGAGWGFVIWGGLNGCYLVVNHAWQKLRGDRPPSPVWIEVGTLVTFVAVMFSRVFFRSPDTRCAARVLGALTRFDASSVARGQLFLAVALGALYFFCRAAPNTHEFLAGEAPVLGKVAHSGYRFRWTVPSAAVLGCLAAAAVLRLTRVSEFLYFQF